VEVESVSMTTGEINVEDTGETMVTGSLTVVNGNETIVASTINVIQPYKISHAQYKQINITKKRS
jgi:hypothetical protein